MKLMLLEIEIIKLLLLTGIYSLQFITMQTFIMIEVGSLIFLTQVWMQPPKSPNGLPKL